MTYSILNLPKIRQKIAIYKMWLVQDNQTYIINFKFVQWNQNCNQMEPNPTKHPIWLDHMN